MDSHVKQLVAIAFINSLGTVAGAITGFGSNVIFQIGWYTISLLGWGNGSMKQSDLILTLTSAPPNLIQSYHLWAHVNGQLALLLGLARVVSEVVGVAILFKSDNTRLQRALGGFLLVVFLWQALVERKIRQHPPEGRYSVCTRHRCAAVCASGLFSGLFGGLFAAPGPPLMVFVLVANIDKDEWRGTNSVINCMTFVSRILSFLWLDPDKLESGGIWLPCVIVMVTSIGALLLGNILATRVSQATFRDLLLVFLFCGGLSLITAGMGDFSVVIVAVGMVAIGVLTFAFRRSESADCMRKEFGNACPRQPLTDCAEAGLCLENETRPPLAREFSPAAPEADQAPLMKSEAVGYCC